MPLSAGRFTVQLNGGGQFGAGAFSGSERYLLIAVRCAGDGDYSVLTPRQDVAARPYALYSRAAPWSGLQDMPLGFVDGQDADRLAALPCSDGQVAERTASAWECVTPGEGIS